MAIATSFAPVRPWTHTPRRYPEIEPAGAPAVEDFVYRRGMSARPNISDIKTIPLFAGFGDAELEAIAALFAPAQLRNQAGKPGLIFDVGEPATSFYLLTAGEVLLDRPGDDIYRLRPPALIGELGALTSLGRTCRASIDGDATVWAMDAAKLQAFFRDHQEMGLRFLVNLLGVVADKVQRDQRRMADMRTNLVRTQKQLKKLRELVLDAPETPLSAPVHDALDVLISHNRRINYRVEPPTALAAGLRNEHGEFPVIELSRTHVSVQWPKPAAVPAVDDWISGALDLAGAEIPISGRVIRAIGQRVTIELDLLIEEFSAAFEGYLTRLQLLDILV